MESTVGAPAETRHPTDPRRDLTRRVAKRVYFSKSPKLRAFLLYVCENAIAGCPENVREQLIGCKVFGRLPEYNSGDDNIVRVEAMELRKRLEAYFAGEGRGEPVVIEIPRGGYMPAFSSRASEPAVPRDTVARDSAGVPPQTEARKLPLTPLLAAALLISVAAMLWLAMDNRRLREQSLDPSALTAAGSSQDYSFYGDLLGSLGTVHDREMQLVLSNPRVVVYFGSRTNDRPQPFDQVVLAPKELKSTFGYALNSVDRDSPFQFLHLTRNDYTGMGEAVAAFQMGRLMQLLHRPVRLTQSRFLNWEYVPKQDLIVLGGPNSNDWTYQDGAQSTFNFEVTGIEDRDPRPGEARHYVQHSDPGEKASQTEYGVVKMLVSPYGFKTLLLAGSTSTGTEGVGQFFADPVRMKKVCDGMRRASPGKPFPAEWEVLIKVTDRDSIPVQTSAVALRPVRREH